jgi:hypothetical protein
MPRTRLTSADFVEGAVEGLVDAAFFFVIAFFCAVEGFVVIGVDPIAEGIGDGLGVFEFESPFG